MKRSDVLQILSVMLFIAGSLYSPDAWQAVICMALCGSCVVLSLLHMFYVERKPMI